MKKIKKNQLLSSTRDQVMELLSIGQHSAVEQSTVVGQEREFMIAGNPECVGVGALVGGVPCKLMPEACVNDEMGLNK